MKTGDAVGLGIFIGIVMAFIILIIMCECAPKQTFLYQEGYKQGQIDALTGKVNWQLKEHSDKTKTWEAIDENK